MIKFVKNVVIVSACFSSFSAFAISDNQWLKALKTTFKSSRQPSNEFLDGKVTWQCLESRTDGFNEIQTYRITRVGALILAENVHDKNITYSFVADPITKSLAAASPRSEVQLFARETLNSVLLIEMTSKDQSLKTRSSVSFWLKVFGYISCSVE